LPARYNAGAVVALREGIGPAIKALRERRSLTQIDLAERCHLSRGAIGQFERGLVSPSLEEALDRLVRRSIDS
jgi:DNA-binding XRE family transcriptional regulator